MTTRDVVVHVILCLIMALVLYVYALSMMRLTQALGI